MRTLGIILDQYAPERHDVMWILPQENNGVTARIYNNGKWNDLVLPKELMDSLLTEAEADGMYLRKEDASLTYLSKEDAGKTYQPKGDYALQSSLTSGLAGKMDNFTAGTGLEMTPDRKLNVTLDTTVFYVLQTLPEAPASGNENKICLVPASTPSESNAYTEYIWVDGKWEILGTYISSIDLTDYLTKSEAQSAYVAKEEGKTLTSNDYTDSDKARVDGLSDLKQLYAYGVEWTDGQTDLTRIGNLEYHKSLPIQSSLRGCIGSKDGVSYYFDPANWDNREDGAPAVLDGTDGDICVEVPRFYLWSETDEGVNRVWISLHRLVPYALEIPHCLVTADRCTLDRTNSRFCCVVNTGEQFRGGNNNTSLDTYLETDPCRTLLGKPATGMNITSAHAYAEAAGGQLMSYDYYKAIFYWLWVIEYATFNSQKAYNPDLDADGYHQGGMGNGLTAVNGTYWGYYNSSNPITPCGYCNDLGNGTGIKEMTFSMPTESGGEPAQEYTVQIPRWRGFTNIFGDLWTQVSGTYIVRTGESSTEAWRGISKDAWDTTNKTGKTFCGALPNTNGYISKFRLGEQADIIPAEVGSSYSTGMCDYCYCPSTDSGQYNNPRWLAVGGCASSGAHAGLGFFYCDVGASGAYSTAGFRMIYPLE